MPVIKVRENEPFDVALRRFKRSCEKAGVLAEVRRREFYEKPTTERVVVRPCFRKECAAYFRLYTSSFKLPLRSLPPVTY